MASPAATKLDHVLPKHGRVISGSNDVFIEGRPASREGDVVTGGDFIISGSSTVFINDRYAATAGSRTKKRRGIITGSATVFIGGHHVSRP